MQRKKSKGFLDKKGSIQDIVFIMIVGIVVSIIILICFMLMSKLNDQFQASEFIIDDSKAASQKITDFFPNVFDQMFLFIIIAVSIISIVLAALVRIHPIFLVFFILGIIFLVFFSGIFTNLYTEIANNEQFSTYSTQLSYINITMQYLPWIILIIGSIIIIVTYNVNKNDFN